MKRRTAWLVAGLLCASACDDGQAVVGFIPGVMHADGGRGDGGGDSGPPPDGGGVDAGDTPVGCAGPPVAVVGLGNNHACAAVAGGDLYCWGQNDHGQLGNGDPMLADRLLPVRVAGPLAGSSHVVGGRNHSCAINGAGELYCWGDNVAGQLGIAMAGGREENPVRVGVETDWIGLSSYSDSTCGIRSGGALYCWGANDAGQLGLGDGSDRDEPERVEANTWSQVNVGQGHTCGVRTDGSLFCWGRNDDAQLGNDSTAAENDPDPVDGGGTWRAVAACSNHTCALRTDRSVWCWGRGAEGQLGDGNTVLRRTPVRAELAQPAVAITCGNDMSCAITDDGRLYCWGESPFHGLGTGVDELTPTQLGAASDWTAFDAEDEHVCAIRAGGRVFCWGENDDGELGIGDRTDRDTPTETCILP